MAKHSLPFTLSKRKESKFWSVRFKDEKTGKYLPAKSTKQTNKEDAMKVALKWFSTGVISSGNQEESLDNLCLWNSLKQKELTKQDFEKVVELGKKQGFIKSCVLKGDQSDILFSEYLINFWTWDKSEYVQEKLRTEKKIGKSHVLKCYNLIKNYWIDWFEGKLLGDITKQDIKDFLNHITKLDRAASTKNQIWLAGATPLRYAYYNDKIEKDITAGITGFYGKSKDREILTPELVQALFTIDWKDPRAKLANILAMCTGLRSGEVRALRKKDLGEMCLYIRHSWNDREGLKCTKNGEERVVQLPFPGLTKTLLELAESNPFRKDMDAFVFYSTIPEKPIEEHIFLDGLHDALERIGMSKENARKYVFHSWRHYFASYMHDRVNTKLLQSQTGHKTIAMLEHYAGHEVTGDVERIQTAQLEMFGDVVSKFDIEIDTKALYKNIKTEWMDKTVMYEHTRQLR